MDSFGESETVIRRDK